MKSYNFTQCENPRVIRNRYTGDYIRVGCGCCRGCALQRRDRMSLLCQQEEKKHLYCLFVTLTYNQDSVPLLQPIRKDFRLTHGYRLFNLCHRLRTLGSMVHFEPDYYHNNQYWLNRFLSKVNCNGFIPYASVRDAQLFLKRLRKYLSYYTDEKIKYYLCAEYGPVHFRPHYHLLLFFNEKPTKHYVGRCIKLAWAYKQKTKKKISEKRTKTIYKLRRFGRIDYSFTEGNAHNYVAGYVNCSVRLPKFYTFASFARPFVLHSKNFGNPILPELKEKIYEDESYGFTSLSLQTKSGLSTYELQNSFKSRFFPKCRGYNSKSFNELYQTYSIFARAKQEYGTDNITCLANNIWFQLHQNINDSIVEPFKYILKCPDYHRLNDPIKNRHDLFVNKIKHDLYFSKHFHTFVCDSNPALYHKRLKQIYNFWNADSIKKLKNFYQTQIDYLNEVPLNGDFLPFMYDNFEVFFADHFNDYSGDLYTFSIYENFEQYCLSVFNKMFNLKTNSINFKFKPIIQSHHMYDYIMCDVATRFERSIKHKKQNDLNKLLIND